MAGPYKQATRARHHQRPQGYQVLVPENNNNNLENPPFHLPSCQQPSKGETRSPLSTPLTPIRRLCSHTLLSATLIIKKDLPSTLDDETKGAFLFQRVSVLVQRYNATGHLATLP